MENEEIKNTVEETSVDSSIKNNKKNIVTIAIIAAVVLVVGVIGFFGYRMLSGKNPVKATSNAIRGLNDKIDDAANTNKGISKIMEGDKPYELNTKFTLELPEEIGGTYNLDVLAQIDNDEQIMNISIDAKEKAKALASLEALMLKDKFYFRTPDTMSKFYFASLKDMGIEDLYKELASVESNMDLDYDFENIIEYLADALDKGLDKKDFDKEKAELKIGEDTKKVTKYTIDVTQKEVLAVASAFADKVLNDEDLLKLVAKLSDTDEKQIKLMLEQIKTVKAEDDKTKMFTYSVYVTGMGTAVGYEFEIDANNKIIIKGENDLTQLELVLDKMPITIDFEKINDNKSEIRINLSGIAVKLEINSEVKTVKRNKEYDEKVELVLTATVGAESIKASLKADSNIKVIDSIDKSATKDAIDVSKMAEAEQSIFMNEFENSGFGSLVKMLSESSLLDSTLNSSVNQNVSANIAY